VSITGQSWEFGTLFQTLLELYNPALTPFNWNPNATNNTTPAQINEILTSKVLGWYDFSGLQSNNAAIASYLSTSPPDAIWDKPIMDNGALGDPASMGSALWAVALLGSKSGSQFSSQQLAWVAANQLLHLQNGAKDERGCISHRDGYVQFWSDQGYMIPPFIAYLGLATGNADLLSQALDQWTCVSDTLLTGDNIYSHITQADFADTGLWATGNGWMLMGLMRVLASINASGFATDARFADRVAAAEQTAVKVFTALFAQLTEDNRLPNYLLNTGDSAGDSAGTAAVVAAFYRFYKLNKGLATPFIAAADRAFGGVVDKVSNEGWLTWVVDPSGNGGFNVADWVKSPEGQTFTLLMYQARTDAGI
jgi:hypothetical protein